MNTAINVIAELLIISQSDAWNGSTRLDDALEDARNVLRRYRDPIQEACEETGVSESQEKELRTIAVALGEENEE